MGEPRRNDPLQLVVAGVFGLLFGLVLIAMNNPGGEILLAVGVVVTAIGGVLMAKMPKQNKGATDEQNRPAPLTGSIAGAMTPEIAVFASVFKNNNGESAILILVGGSEPRAVANAIGIEGMRLFDQERFNPAFGYEVEVRVVSKLTPDSPEMRTHLDAAASLLIMRSHAKGKALSVQVVRD